MLNELNNTGVAWTTQEWRFNYICGKSDYQINVANFGKPIQVLRETGNCQIPYIPVPFDDITEQNYGKLLAGYYASCGIPWLWDNETIERVSFYREGAMDSQPWLSIQPMPSQNVTYIVVYLIGYNGTTDPLMAESNLPEHAEMLRLRTAMGLLPYAQWYDEDEKNRVKRKDLAEAFAYQLNRKERNYNEYKASISHGRDVDVAYWN